jgi:uncharacterized surface protein with fasciclin (FAS1) repeats
MINPIKRLTISALFGLCGLGLAAAEAAIAAPPQPVNVPVEQQVQQLAQAGTIVEVAAGEEQFSTLVTALQAANLVEPLSSEGPFTVFAPTNAAFAALPAGTLEALLEPENQDLLTEVLTYHVVAGELGADSVIAASSIETLNGEVDVDVVDDDVMINDANVVAADIEASNGVIHVIDQVLIPEGVVATLEERMAATTMTRAEATTTPEATTTTTPDTATETAPAEPVRGLW